MPEPVPTATITAEQLSRLTGFSVAELSTLSKKGYFPKVKDGNFEQTKALVGCFKAYRDKLQEAGALPVYQSMAECATQTGIPKSVLKAARKESAESFRAHRILLGPLLKWIFSRDGDSVDWGNRLKRADALLREHALEQKQNRTVDKEEVAFGIHKTMSLLFASLDKSSDQLPAILGGMDAAGIKFKLTESNEALKAELRGGFEALFCKQK
jgi:hypothetical protein